MPMMRSLCRPGLIRLLGTTSAKCAFFDVVKRLPSNSTSTKRRPAERIPMCRLSAPGTQPSAGGRPLTVTTSGGGGGSGVGDGTSPVDSATVVPPELVADTRQTRVWPASPAWISYDAAVTPVELPSRSQSKANVGEPVQEPGSQVITSPGAPEDGIEGALVFPGGGTALAARVTPS